MAIAFIGLGSNLGERAEYLQKAVDELSKLKLTTVVKLSSVYETEPVGIKEQPDFLNMVAELETKLSSGDLMDGLKMIEHNIGRTHMQHWGPREIDLDMLYYNQEILHDKKLDLPHPELVHRRFMLVPMNDIAPDFVDPLRHLTIKELLLNCSDVSAVKRTGISVSLRQREI